MKPVTDITDYRRAKRSEYLAKHSERIDAIIRNFIRINSQFNFQHMASAYVHSRYNDKLVSWDYLDFRENLHEALASELSKLIFAELCKSKWFEPRFMNLDQITDRCISLLILDDWAAIS